jgi:hypothetical protein
MLPYLSKSYGSLAAGFQFQDFITLSTLPSIGVVFKNYGIQTGIMGKLFIVDYRLEYQFYQGEFMPSFYDQTYDRTRGKRASDMVARLAAGQSSTTIKMGIFGKFGFNILDFLYLNIGYKWPWNVNGTQIVPDDNPDYFTASLSFADDVLPYGIGFSLGFDRQFFVPIFTRTAQYSISDQYTVFKGRVDVPIGNFFKIRATIGTAARRDIHGDIVVTNGVTQVMPTFTIESIF